MDNQVNEAIIDETGGYIDVADIDEKRKSVCKIEIPLPNNRLKLASGFLGEFQTSEDTIIYGLFTNNHVINSTMILDSLRSGSTLCICRFENTTGEMVDIDIEIEPGMFWYTEIVSDFTFIEVSEEKRLEILREGFEFLYIEKLDPHEVPNGGDKVWILQHPRGMRLAIGINTILKIVGFDIYHKVPTQGGSSGSPVFNQRNQVIGIHKTGGSLRNTAVCINYVIERLMFQYRINSHTTQTQRQRDNSTSSIFLHFTSLSWTLKLVYCTQVVLFLTDFVTDMHVVRNVLNV